MLGLVNKLPKAFRKWLFLIWSLTTRSMTLGVRGIVLNDNGHVLLVRHTYVGGWHLPGGGVERGETMHEAIEKEIWEETNIRSGSDPRLFAMYRNPLTSRFDHVALFIVDDWSGARSMVPNSEIAGTGFFPQSSLPDETTEPTRTRLHEVFANLPVRALW